MEKTDGGVDVVFASKTIKVIAVIFSMFAGSAAFFSMIMSPIQKNLDSMSLTLERMKDEYSANFIDLSNKLNAKNLEDAKSDAEMKSELSNMKIRLEMLEKAKEK